ncbi:Hypothetical predicted protein [Scomber scombrus]|uniref:Secreted protein n=1 Tax=Scomber scombrus TaxID=13677 RepID=A0AAV1N6Z1_SCOSC
MAVISACTVSGLASCPIMRVLSLHAALLHPTSKQQSRAETATSGAPAAAERPFVLHRDAHPSEKNHHKTPRQAFLLCDFHDKYHHSNPL